MCVGGGGVGKIIMVMVVSNAQSKIGNGRQINKSRA